ncbi:MAG: SH3 domain-containing protein, partial [Anaerolineales bacterium]
MKQGLTITAFLAAAVMISAAAVAEPSFETAPPLQATVTGTPQGPVIIVPDEVNVRVGPGVEYELVGVLIAGSQAPALGRSPGGDWIQIVYPGVSGNVAWVYAAFVTIQPEGAYLAPVEPPPTSTPRVTPTIDPTLAAQFVSLGVGPTRLPTYTPPPPYVPPTLPPNPDTSGGGFPPILATLGLLVVGVFGGVISV